MTIPSVAPARPLLAYDRRTGAPVAMVPSCSKPGAYHLVTATSCDCRGFRFRGRCSHLAPLAVAAEPLPCAACHNYHLTDADRVKAHPDANPRPVVRVPLLALMYA